MMITTTRRRPSDYPIANFRQLSRLFDEVFGATDLDANGTASVSSAWVPPTDIFEDKEQIKLVLELPGVKPEAVKLSLENNALTVRGEKKQVAEEHTERVHRYERSYGLFERTFTLPSTVDADRIEANYEQGVLTVRLPKVERARPREIPVRAS